RRRIAALYDDLLAGVPGVRTPPPLPEGHNSSSSFYWVQVDAAIRDRIATDLRRRGIATAFRYPPLHRAPTGGALSTATGAAAGPLPHTDEAAAQTLLLPMHQGLGDEEVRTVAEGLGAAVRERMRPAAAGAAAD
ncbi:DegT/DnrJ/EryC1/StrS family aminotransferase, partial [Streptomyces coeruleorubidus]|uniref:DegT/DnrJ/EryC1/StrS family aminotransferase n=1 Tax=Streptomyces coeruleorubidus TaxID=116188 RepID=UPI0037876FA6